MFKLDELRGRASTRYKNIALDKLIQEGKWYLERAEYHRDANPPFVSYVFLVYFHNRYYYITVFKTASKKLYVTGPFEMPDVLSSHFWWCIQKHEVYDLTDFLS